MKEPWLLEHCKMYPGLQLQSREARYLNVREKHRRVSMRFYAADFKDTTLKRVVGRAWLRIKNTCGKKGVPQSCEAVYSRRMFFEQFEGRRRLRRRLRGFWERLQLPQHFLYFFPLPQGQGALRLILGSERL